MLASRLDVFLGPSSGAEQNALTAAAATDGPPQHWLEKVQQGAPQLLRPSFAGPRTVPLASVIRGAACESEPLRPVSRVQSSPLPVAPAAATKRPPVPSRSPARLRWANEPKTSKQKNLHQATPSQGAGFPASAAKERPAESLSTLDAVANPTVTKPAYAGRANPPSEMKAPSDKFADGNPALEQRTLPPRTVISDALVAPITAPRPQIERPAPRRSQHQSIAEGATVGLPHVAEQPHDTTNMSLPTEPFVGNSQSVSQNTPRRAGWIESPRRENGAEPCESGMTSTSVHSSNTPRHQAERPARTSDAPVEWINRRPAKDDFQALAPSIAGGRTSAQPWPELTPRTTSVDLDDCLAALRADQRRNKLNAEQETNRWTA